MNMKTLQPSLKERKRYILIKVISEFDVEKEKLFDSVAKAGLQFLGELGMAKAGLQILPETYDQKNKTFIVRTGHKFVNETKSALILIKEIDGRKVTLKSVRVSGVVDKLKP